MKCGDLEALKTMVEAMKDDFFWKKDGWWEGGFGFVLWLVFCLVVCFSSSRHLIQKTIPKPTKL